jgi:hypothetical protein
MADPRNILAGVGAGGAAGLSLAFFAPLGTLGPVAATGTAGVQTVTITGTPTGGTFTLTWNGQTTAPIAYNATASAVQSALQALPGGSGLTATGGPLPTTAVAVNLPAAVNQSAITANGAALSGGSTPAVAVAQTTPGTQATNEATASLPTAFLDSGYCDQKGLDFKTNTSSNDVKGYGTTQVLRTIISDQKKTIDLTFLETNPTSVAVYNSVPLGSIVPDSSGFFKVTSGVPKNTQYAAVFDAVDGSNHMRYYAPAVQNITPGDLNLAAGQAITRPISLTCYPDVNGNTLYEYYVIANLAH